MREIGGYIELDTYRGKMLHENAVKLNCGRNCLAYLVQAYNIFNIALPYFLCNSVFATCKKMGVDVIQYHVDSSFHPDLGDIEIEKDRWLYVVNYYGQLSDDYICGLKTKYERIILDNAQAFYSMPLDGIPTIYTPRKYFGLPDGGLLYTERKIRKKLSVDRSSGHMGFLLGRYEGKASDFYIDYVKNNERFESESIKRMSLLTENLMHGIDYGYVSEKRSKNYDYLRKRFEDKNKLKPVRIKGAFAYPLMTINAQQIRKKMIEKKIYIPVLWPEVEEKTGTSDMDRSLAHDVLPLPVDQRYGLEDMEYMADSIEEEL